MDAEPVVKETEEEVRARIRKEARKMGVRWTNQRETIVEVFISTEDHFTVEELHQRVREVDPSVSTATVYRTVNLLVDIGVAVKRDFDTASATFECIINKDHHHHLINMSTGEAIEFMSDELEELKERIARELGFKLVHHKLELFGVPLDEENKNIIQEAP